MNQGKKPWHDLILFFHERVWINPTIVTHTLDRSSKNFGLVQSLKAMEDMGPVFLSIPLEALVKHDNQTTDHIDSFIFDSKSPDVIIDHWNDFVHQLYFGDSVFHRQDWGVHDGQDWLEDNLQIGNISLEKVLVFVDEKLNHENECFSCPYFHQTVHDGDYHFLGIVFVGTVKVV